MKTTSLKLWLCEYDETGSWGYYRSYSAVTFAETQSAALGWLLMEYADTAGEKWTLTEIDTSKAGVTQISHSES